MSSVVRVAVGVVRDSLGRMLIALRPSHKHQGGRWEFPGGKIEAGESSEAALSRELLEELGIVVRRSVPLLSVPFSYSDKKVLLEVREVLSFDGDPCGKEGQEIRWVSARDLGSYKFPDANSPIVKAVSLPDLICISGAYSSDTDFDVRLRKAIGRGAGLVVFRPVDGVNVSVELVRSASNSCSDAEVPLVVSSALNPSFWGYADGVHLRADHLWKFDERPLEASKWFGASCHSLEEVERAKALGVDYVFLSPVLPTSSHPGARTLGWAGFEGLAAHCCGNGYALGGMRIADLEKSRQVGARGIAAISSFWE